MSLKNKQITIKSQFKVLEQLLGKNYEKEFWKVFNGLDEQISGIVNNNGRDDGVKHVNNLWRKFFANVSKEIIDRQLDEMSDNPDYLPDDSLAQLKSFVEDMSSQLAGDIHKSFGGSAFGNGVDLDRDFEKTIANVVKPRFNGVGEAIQEKKDAGTYHLDMMIEEMGGYQREFEKETASPNKKVDIGNCVEGLSTSIRVMETHYKNRSFFGRLFFGGKERRAIAAARAAVKNYADSIGKNVDEFINENVKPSKAGLSAINTLNKPIAVTASNFETDSEFIEKEQRNLVLKDLEKQMQEKGMIDYSIKDYLMRTPVNELMDMYKTVTGKEYDFGDLKEISLEKIEENREDEAENKNKIEDRIYDANDYVLNNVMKKQNIDIFQALDVVSEMSVEEREKKAGYFGKKDTSQEQISFHEKQLENFYYEMSNIKGTSRDIAEAEYKKMSYLDKKEFYELYTGKDYNSSEYFFRHEQIINDVKMKLENGSIDLPAERTKDLNEFYLKVNEMKGISQSVAEKELAQMDDKEKMNFYKNYAAREYNYLEYTNEKKSVFIAAEGKVLIDKRNSLIAKVETNKDLKMLLDTKLFEYNYSHKDNRIDYSNMSVKEKMDLHRQIFGKDLELMPYQDPEKLDKVYGALREYSRENKKVDMNWQAMTDKKAYDLYNKLCDEGKIKAEKFEDKSEEIQDGMRIVVEDAANTSISDIDSSFQNIEHSKQKVVEEKLKAPKKNDK